MPQTTTKKKKAVGDADKGPSVAGRFSALEAKIGELEGKVIESGKKIELVIKAVAEGRMDLL